MTTIFGAEFRQVLNRDHLGKPALVAIATRTYDTTVEDLWAAITTPARIARWFLPLEGDLQLGGRYQLEGNAGGTIQRCDPPSALDLTWEFGGGTSWVTVRIAPAGARAKLTLEHIAHRDGIGEEHMKKFGPGAVGIGWDLTLKGLEIHVADGERVIDGPAWLQSPEANGFIRASGDAWGLAHAASGEDPEEARAKAERTIAAYTGG